MGSFGERLRREREMRGIGLDEISTATKISARNLRALEEEKFDQLPGGIFNKGFVRAYAKFLGIDEEDIVGQYEVASRDTEAAREQKLQEEFAKGEFRKPKSESEISLEPKSQWGTIAVIVLIAALAYVGYSYYQRQKLEKQQQSVPAATSTAATPVRPAQSPTTTPNPGADVISANSAAATPATEQPSAESKTGAKAATQKPGESESSTTSSASAPGNVASAIELKIKVNQESWVSIKADGKTLVSATLEPGVERSFKATDKIEMVLGNAGGVEVSYNGKPVENLNVQDVRRLTFTPTGYQ